MDPAFWHRRWTNDQIAFHQADGHAALPEHWPELGLARGTPVFVPLCGKSHDMAWLAGRGHPVTGVELSARAAADFFDEHGLGARRSTAGDFDRFAADGIAIHVGDIFVYPAAEIAAFPAFYDRAALIALPAAMRRRYVDHVFAALPSGARGLLIAFDYPPRDMDGPPFAVTDDEVRAVLAPYADVELRAEDDDTLRDSEHLRRRGLTRATERVYRVTRR